VQERDAVICQEGMELPEELAIVRPADMLEHSDRDNAVERAIQRAVVLK